MVNPNDGAGPRRNGGGNGEWTHHSPETPDLGLMRALFDRMTDAVVRVAEARQTTGDPQAPRQALLQLRAVALLLASIPAPTLDAMRYKAMAAAALAREDDDPLSYARQLIEIAIALDDERLQGSPWAVA